MKYAVLFSAIVSYVHQLQDKSIITENLLEQSFESGNVHDVIVSRMPGGTTLGDLAMYSLVFPSLYLK